MPMFVLRKFRSKVEHITEQKKSVRGLLNILSNLNLCMRIIRVQIILKLMFL